MYCIPMLYEGVNEVFYNSNLLTKYNIPIPHTWNQLLSSLAAAKKDGLIPMAFGDKDGFPGEHMWMWLLATTCGAAKVNAAINTTTTKFTDPCFVEAAARIQQLQNDGYFSPGPAGVAYATAQAVFASGKAAFYQTGNWYLGTPPTTFKLGVIAPAPGVSPSESEGSIIQVFGIPSKGSNKAAAAKFLDFLFTPAFGVPWVHTTQQWDVADNVIDKGGAALAKQTFDQGYKNTKSSIPFLELALPIPIGEQQIYKGVQDLLTGQMTPQAFTASVQTALDKARAKATK
jgi:raffinose/stachyose/melibiose transport system substrate-binding protein